MCKDNQEKNQKLSSEKNNSLLRIKFKDLEEKMRIIATCFDELNVDNNDKINTLTQKVLSYFGGKL